jgi:hypothetical protein
MTNKCECGEWSGEYCGAEGASTVVEYMPESVRATHEAAGYSGIDGCGQYPANGALRIIAARDCADEMLDQDRDWCRVVEDEVE